MGPANATKRGGHIHAKNRTKSQGIPQNQDFKDIKPINWSISNSEYYAFFEPFHPASRRDNCGINRSVSLGSLDEVISWFSTPENPWSKITWWDIFAMGCSHLMSLYRRLLHERMKVLHKILLLLRLILSFSMQRASLEPVKQFLALLCSSLQCKSR